MFLWCFSLDLYFGPPFEDRAHAYGLNKRVGHRGLRLQDFKKVDKNRSYLGVRELINDVIYK